MLNEQKTGPVSSADGAVNVARIDKQGAGVVTQAHGMYAEGSIRKNLYFSYCEEEATSIPALNSIGNIVWNPPGSGVNLSLLKWSAQIGATSAGCLGVSLAYTAQAIEPTTPTAADSSGCAYLDASSPGYGKAHAFSVGTVQAIPTVVMNLFHNKQAIMATGVDNMSGDFEGLFSVPPGYVVVLATLAVAAVDMTSTLTWEEIPI